MPGIINASGTLIQVMMLDGRLEEARRSLSRRTAEPGEFGQEEIASVAGIARALSEDVKRKIALFCNVEFGAVIESRDVPTIYQIPLSFAEQGIELLSGRDARAG